MITIPSVLCKKPASNSQPLRCREFFQVLKDIGASLGVRYCRASEHRGEVEEVRVVQFRCSQGFWDRVFGTFCDATECQQTPGGASCCSSHCWEYRCVDGLVKCYGYLMGQQQDGPQVVLQKVTCAETARVYRNCKSAYPAEF